MGPRTPSRRSPGRIRTTRKITPVRRLPAPAAAFQSRPRKSRPPRLAKIGGSGRHWNNLKPKFEGAREPRLCVLATSLSCHRPLNSLDTLPMKNSPRTHAPSWLRFFLRVDLLLAIAMGLIIVMTVGPQILASSGNGRKTRATFHLQLLRAQIARFRFEQGRYPETLEELTKTRPYLSTGGSLREDPADSPSRYLREIPHEPLSGSRRVTLVGPAPASGLQGTPGEKDAVSETPVSESDGWLYNAGTGQVSINSPEYRDL